MSDKIIVTNPTSYNTFRISSGDTVWKQGRYCTGSTGKNCTRYDTPEPVVLRASSNIPKKSATYYYFKTEEEANDDIVFSMMEHVRGYADVVNVNSFKKRLNSYKNSEVGKQAVLTCDGIRRKLDEIEDIMDAFDSKFEEEDD